MQTVPSDAVFVHRVRRSMPTVKLGPAQLLDAITLMLLHLQRSFGRPRGVFVCLHGFICNILGAHGLRLSWGPPVRAPAWGTLGLERIHPRALRGSRTIAPKPVCMSQVCQWPRANRFQHNVVNCLAAATGKLQLGSIKPESSSKVSRNMTGCLSFARKICQSHCKSALCNCHGKRKDFYPRSLKSNT